MKMDILNFRLNDGSIGENSNGKDFGDVTLAWEDEGEEIHV